MYPQLSHYSKKSETGFRNELAESRNISRPYGNEYNSKENKQFKTNRLRRSSDIEVNTNDFTVTTENIQMSETNEFVETSQTIQSTVEIKDLVDSVSSSTTSKNNKEEDTTLTGSTISDTTFATNTKTESEELYLFDTTFSTTISSDRDDVINETLMEVSNNANDTLIDYTLKKVDKLSDQIRAVLRHYENAGVVTIPGQKLLPDPLPMADLKKNFGFGTTMTFINMSVYGLNNFTIEHVNTDVDRLQVSI